MTISLNLAVSTKSFHISSVLDVRYDFDKVFGRVCGLCEGLACSESSRTEGISDFSRRRDRSSGRFVRELHLYT